MKSVRKPSYDHEKARLFRKMKLTGLSIVVVLAMVLGLVSIDKVSAMSQYSAAFGINSCMI